jgi:hypothetical protein
MRNKSEIILIVMKIDIWDGSAGHLCAPPAAGRSSFPAALAAFAALLGGAVQRAAML